MSLLLPCLITIAIETMLFAAAGYRERLFLLLCACVNAATNLSLNLLMSLLYAMGAELTLAVYPLEAAVVLIEFLVLAAVKGRSWKLFLLVLAANVLSYGAGILIYGHV